ncbi:MAG: hypothetical protein U0169_23475 [Polyangiaceae bacterium]
MIERGMDWAKRGMRARVRRLATVMGSASVVFVLLATACSTAKEEGGIVLALQTDLSLPKDVNVVRIVISIDGEDAPVHDQEYPVGPGPTDTKIPATLVVRPSKTNPKARMRAKVIAIKDSIVVDGVPVKKPRVLREVVTVVPVDGKARTLRMPLKWLCYDERSIDPNAAKTGEATSACGEGTTCIAGTCANSFVDPATLPDFSEDDVFGKPRVDDATKRECFTLFACMAQPGDPSTTALAQDVTDALDVATCSVPKPEGDAAIVNVAFKSENSGSGICDDSGKRCFFPVDRATTTNPEDLAEGWSLDPSGARILLPKGYCTTGTSTRKSPYESGARVVVSSGCASKTVTTPTCSPWTGAGESEQTKLPDVVVPDAGAPKDGGAIPDARAPDATVGDAGAVDSGRPDTSVPADAAGGDASSPEGGVPQCPDGTPIVSGDVEVVRCATSRIESFSVFDKRLAWVDGLISRSGTPLAVPEPRLNQIDVSAPVVQNVTPIVRTLPPTVQPPLHVALSQNTSFVADSAPSAKVFYCRMSATDPNFACIGAPAAAPHMAPLDILSIGTVVDLSASLSHLYVTTPSVATVDGGVPYVALAACQLATSGDTLTCSNAAPPLSSFEVRLPRFAPNYAAGGRLIFFERAQGPGTGPWQLSECSGPCLSTTAILATHPTGALEMPRSLSVPSSGNGSDIVWISDRNAVHNCPPMSGSPCGGQLDYTSGSTVPVLTDVVAATNRLGAPQRYFVEASAGGGSEIRGCAKSPTDECAQGTLRSVHASPRPIPWMAALESYLYWYELDGHVYRKPLP